jgi:hypothetical protein
MGFVGREKEIGQIKEALTEGNINLLKIEMTSVSLSRLGWRGLG